MKDHPAVPVDLGIVEELLSELTTIRAVTTLENPPSPQELGLASATTTITLTGSKTGQKVLRIGAETPTSSGYYARLDAGPPIIVNQESIDRVLELFRADALIAVTPTPDSTGTAPATMAP